MILHFGLVLHKRFWQVLIRHEDQVYFPDPDGLVVQLSSVDHQPQ